MDQTMQAAEIIVKAIDRLKKEVKPTAEEISSSAISGETNVEDALAYLKAAVDLLTSNRVKTQNGNVDTPELLAMKINNTGNTSDVITWGGGLSAGSPNVGGILFTHSGRKYIFRSKGLNNGANEDYELPNHSDGNSDVVYKIITEKDFPFVRQKGSSPGGTTSGDGTNKITFTSPGDGRFCLLFFAKEMTNIFCASASDSIVYSGTIPSGWSLTKTDGTYTLTRTATTVFAYTVLWI